MNNANLKIVVFFVVVVVVFNFRHIRLSFLPEKKYVSPLFSIQHSINIFIKLDRLKNASYKLVCITPHQQEELADFLVSKVCTKETGVKF